jgi:uncharacterized delta-60 repeat protein
MSVFAWLRKRLSIRSHRRDGFQIRPPAPPCRPQLEALEDRCLLSGGVLDPTFGSGGLVTTTAGGLSTAFAVATYPAGITNASDVVAVGDATVGSGTNTRNEPAIVRYDLNGALDTSFGGTGAVILNLKAGGMARAVVVQPDGKIVVNYTSGTTFNLARSNANGTQDTAFGASGTGIVSISTGKGTTDTAYSLALEPNDDIVVAGTVSSSTGMRLALVRYTASGLLDTSFGPGGIVTSQFASPLDLDSSGANFIDLVLDTSTLDPDAGKIVVVTRLAATGHPDVVARYHANCSLDTSFAGSAGYEILSNLTLMPSVAVQSNGHIIVAGGNGASIELDRLNPDGSFDSTFGSGGIVAVSPPPNTIYYDDEGVTIQPDGKIVTAGPYQNTSTGAQDFFVARFNPADGGLDTSFDTGGVATVASGSSISASTVGIALEPDGRIVAAGSLLTTTGGFALDRFIAYGPEIGSFTASTNPVMAGSNLTLTASNISDEVPSAAITQVAFYVQINGTNTLLGYGTQSSPGVWTLTFTVNVAPGTYTLYAQAEDNYGIFGDPNPLTLQVQ